MPSELILSWITYGAFTRGLSDEFCVNRAIGLFADGVAAELGEIRVAVAEAKMVSTLYQNGQGIYTYRFQNPRVRLVALQPASRFAFQRIASMMINLVLLWRMLGNCHAAHINLPSYTGLIAATICSFRGIPYSIYMGSDWYETGSARFKNWPVGGAALFRLYDKLQQSVIRRAIFCLTAGRALATRYKAWNTHTFETIPMVQFVTNTNIAVNRSTNGELHILCVGNVRPEKGTDVLLQAAGLLRQQGRILRISFVGAIQAEYRIALERLAGKLNLNSEIRYYGYLSDEALLQQCYAEADVFVLPTLGEGFPRVIYEAMLSHCPVVASDIPSIRDNLNNCEAALLVPPANHQSLAKAILLLAEDPEFRNRLVCQGFDFARTKVSGQASSQYLDLLRKFLPNLKSTT